MYIESFLNRFHSDFAPIFLHGKCFSTLKKLPTLRNQEGLCELKKWYIDDTEPKNGLVHDSKPKKGL